MDQSICNNNNDKRTTKTKEKLSLMNYDAELAISFQKDCENLLKQFENRPQHNFKEFAQVWREMKFTGIFEDQQFASMLEVYLENCYLIAKKFVFSANKATRCGAIYLIYALFYKQPIKKWIKIRLTDVEFLRIQQILQEFKPDTLELEFIYNKLCLDNAFLYCAKELELGPHIQRFNLNMCPIFTDGQNLETITAHYEQLKAAIDELKEIDSNYQELLKKYRNNHEIKTVNGGATIYKKIEEMSAECCFNNDSDRELQQQDVDVPLKRKAFANKFATYRAAKKTITAIDLQTDNRQ